jgi:hypothetical protein
MDGDVSAIKEVADRIDGRVPQLVGGDRDNPAQFQRIERVIVQLERQPQPLIEQVLLSRGQNSLFGFAVTAFGRVSMRVYAGVREFADPVGRGPGRGRPLLWRLKSDGR